jgi:hypothetical protein
MIETKKLVALHMAGHTNAQIADITGLSAKRIKDRIHWAMMSDADRAVRRSADRARHPRIQEPSIHENAQVIVAARPPVAVIAERDSRLNRPISIRHDFLGDPEPGRSALDRMVSA